MEVGIFMRYLQAGINKFIIRYLQVGMNRFIMRYLQAGIDKLTCASRFSDVECSARARP